jgi:hypothetical protein
MNYENFVGAVEGLALKYQRMNPGMYVFINRTDYSLELTCMPKEQMRKQWVDQMLTEYSEDFESWSEVILCDKNHKVMVVYFCDCWDDRSGYGISKCSSTDTFDEDTGMAVAFAHFRSYPIPNFI